MGNIKSECFNVRYGIKKGGILSPYSINLYMDDLSGRLKEMYAGC